MLHWRTIKSDVTFKTAFIARLTSFILDAPIARIIGFPFEAMYSIISIHVMSPDPTLNAGTYLSTRSTSSNEYGLVRKDSSASIQRS